MTKYTGVNFGHLQQKPEGFHAPDLAQTCVGQAFGLTAPATRQAKSLTYVVGLQLAVPKKEAPVLNDDTTTSFASEAKIAFLYNKDLAERAVAQLNDEQLRTALHPETNSVAVIMKHVSGNLLSRWTDFLTSDGEKPWRNRDDEFVDSFASRQELMEYWQKGWTCLAESSTHFDRST